MSKLFSGYFWCIALPFCATMFSLNCSSRWGQGTILDIIFPSYLFHLCFRIWTKSTAYQQVSVAQPSKLTHRIAQKLPTLFLPDSWCPGGWESSKFMPAWWLRWVLGIKPEGPEFDPWDSHSRRREWVPTNCPLISTLETCSTLTATHTCTQTKINTNLITVLKTQYIAQFCLYYKQMHNSNYHSKMSWRVHVHTYVCTWTCVCAQVCKDMCCCADQRSGILLYCPLSYTFETGSLTEHGIHGTGYAGCQRRSSLSF